MFLKNVAIGEEVGQHCFKQVLSIPANFWNSLMIALISAYALDSMLFCVIYHTALDKLVL